jgi:hypothetical protein
MVVGASLAGATGAVTGAVLAALRNESIKFYAASMGSNFFLLSSTYIGEEAGGDGKTGIYVSRTDEWICALFLCC